VEVTQPLMILYPGALAILALRAVNSLDKPRLQRHLYCAEIGRFYPY